MISPVASFEAKCLPASLQVNGTPTVWKVDSALRGYSLLNVAQRTRISMYFPAQEITAIASVVGALGVVFVAIQAKSAIRQVEEAQLQTQLVEIKKDLLEEQNKLVDKQIEEDHRRSRRENTIELLRHWSVSVDSRAMSARKLVEKFERSQCVALSNVEEFAVSQKDETLLAACLSGHTDPQDLRTKDGKIHLTPS